MSLLCMSSRPTLCSTVLCMCSNMLWAPSPHMPSSLCTPHITSPCTLHTCTLAAWHPCHAHALLLPAPAHSSTRPCCTRSLHTCSARTHSAMHLHLFAACTSASAQPVRAIAARTWAHHPPALPACTFYLHFLSARHLLGVCACLRLGVCALHLSHVVQHRPCWPTCLPAQVQAHAWPSLCPNCPVCVLDIVPAPRCAHASAALFASQLLCPGPDHCNYILHNAPAPWPDRTCLLCRPQPWPPAFDPCCVPTITPALWLP
jgi:hypothetical protein